MNSYENNINFMTYRPLKRRFYILLTFSVFNFLAGSLWNAWSPIMISIENVYRWNLFEVNLQANIYSIIFCVFAGPFIYFWNKTDIRFIYFLSIFSFVIGTFIRLYPGSVHLQSILIQIGSVITGFGGIMASIAPPVISMLWFPSHERARATATSLSFNSLGVAISPIIASRMVPDISKNGTINMDKGIERYMYLHCTLAILVIGMFMLYFPTKPPILPCKSSENSLRLEFWSGCKALMKNGQFWIVFMVTMVVYGFNSALSAVAFSYTYPMGITQTEFGLLSTVANIFTFLSCLFGGWLGDKFHYKTIIYTNTVFSFIFYIITGLQCLKLIPHTLLSLFIVNSLENFATSFACPVVFEMGCEAAFPVSEEIVTAMLAFSTNIGIVLFLSVCMIPKIGTAWIPFSYAFISLLLIPLMCFYKEDRNRTKCDSTYPGERILEVEDDLCPLIN